MLGNKTIFHNEISIHTPLAGSDHIDQSPAVAIKISIHTPLAGSDCSRPVAWTTVIISIHTPLAGSDQLRPTRIAEAFHFNPHSPCGE